MFSLFLSFIFSRVNKETKVFGIGGVLKSQKQGSVYKHYFIK